MNPKLQEYIDTVYDKDQNDFTSITEGITEVLYSYEQTLSLALRMC